MNKQGLDLIGRSNLRLAPSPIQRRTGCAAQHDIRALVCHAVIFSPPARAGVLTSAIAACSVRDRKKVVNVRDPGRRPGSAHGLIKLRPGAHTSGQGNLAPVRLHIDLVRVQRSRCA